MEMNERIKLLAEQAGCDWWEGRAQRDMTRCDTELQKFAELIVEECRIVVAQVFRKNPIELCGPLAEADDEIARHFGVEE
jgi:hypothetical protein